MSFHSLNLDDLRNDEKGKIRKTPFEHQLDAFAALNKCFDFDKEQGKGALLVLPTGAGKTFTTVKWICDNVVPRNIRVLWLANSHHLLDQAFREIHQYARWIAGTRQTLNVRLVSSSTSHDSPSSILLTDDIVIMTTQTAIANLNCTAEDGLSDKTSDTYVVCTSNDISKLPPEFSRAERFDGIFFLDTPSTGEKDKIWPIHQRRYDIAGADKRPEDREWTGAEIQSCCRLASLLDLSLKEAAKNVVPVAVTAAESVERLRAWAAGRCLDASRAGIYTRGSAEEPKTARRVSRPSTN